MGRRQKDCWAISCGQLREALEPQATMISEIPAFDLALGYEIYSTLLKPVEDGWKSAKNLIVVTSERNETTRRKELTNFTYDTSRCMFCGLCEDACPVDALELTQDFELASYTREGAIWDRQMLEEGPHPTRYRS